MNLSCEDNGTLLLVWHGAGGHFSRFIAKLSRALRDVASFSSTTIVERDTFAGLARRRGHFTRFIAKLSHALRDVASFSSTTIVERDTFAGLVRRRGHFSRFIAKLSHALCDVASFSSTTDDAAPAR